MSSSALPKLQMRGLLVKYLQVHFVGTLTVALGVVTFCKFDMGEPRKQAYTCATTPDFYRNYDSMKDFEEMRKAGVFQSVK
uniref:Cytochrome c oxidase subunit 6C n=1 Tax=Mus spicilegus TaxID=10103 RepID=A0A8C6H1I4_MUSSI